MPSATLEEYLEAIFKLSERGHVRPKQIAVAMGVSAPTVTATLGRLEKRALAERPEGLVTLTPDGYSQAVSIVRRHRLAEVFLHDSLELPWDVVHAEACKLEHAMSPEVATALAHYLGDPERCPHGHVIPRLDGTMPTSDGAPLSEALAGTRYRVMSVDEDGGEEFIFYLGELGLYPGTELTVIEVAPFDGPITVLIDGQEHAVGQATAALVSCSLL